MRRLAVVLRITLLALALALTPEAGQGQEARRVTVRLDGRAVLRLGGADGVDADTRANRVEARLQTLAGAERALPPARVEPAGDTARIVSVAGVPVVTLTRTDAEDNLVPLPALAAQWARATDLALSRARARRTTPMGRFTAEVRGAVESALARTAESALTVVPRALAALLVLAAFGALAVLVRRVLRVVFRHAVDDLTVENLVKQVTYYAIWVVGFLVAVDALGFRAQTVVTGLGLTGLALGFALKDIISNFVSGLLILVLRPFRLGDQIVVGDTEGTVERIRLRATEMRTYGGRLVLVPNAELFTSRLTNNTASPVRRASIQLFVGYEVDLRMVTDVIRSAAAATEGVLADPAASVRIRELGQDDVVVQVRFWADSRRSDFVATRSAVRGAVVEALRAAGVALPDPDARFLVPRDPARWRDVLRTATDAEAPPSQDRPAGR